MASRKITVTSVAAIHDRHYGSPGEVRVVRVSWDADFNLDICRQLREPSRY